ncbi:MAG: TIGR01777 family protein [Propionibacteriales bacterium]|nr:TIGR01777 family protein [Propionibacteriales bacterium]
MKYLIAGSSGFLGTGLRAALADHGDEVTRLVRRQPVSAYESQWDPYTRQVDQRFVDNADVVVAIAGAPIVRPWTSGRRRAIYDSRLAATRTLANAISRSEQPPAFLVQSGVAAYGTYRADTVVDEDDPGEGTGFLRRVVLAVEDAAAEATPAGARVCLLRTGAVLHKSGGALKLMLPAFRLGIAGQVGDGRQYFPAISRRDWVGAVIHLAEDSEASGPFILTAPEPPTNAEFTQAVARALHRPARLRVPGVVFEKTAGELAGELLGSMRAVPRRLIESGYEFQDRTIDEVVAAALA